MQVDKFFLSTLLSGYYCIFHSTNSNWGHSTSMLHISGLVCNLYLLESQWYLLNQVVLKQKTATAKRVCMCSKTPRILAVKRLAIDTVMLPVFWGKILYETLGLHSKKWTAPTCQVAFMMALLW